MEAVLKRFILICPNCQREQVIGVEDESNTTSYSEDTVYQSCPDCSDSPENMLLNAIFGQKDNSSNLWK